MAVAVPHSAEECLYLRQEAGRWLKSLREQVGLSQRQLADATGTQYYTFVSQLETGRGRIPPDRYCVWAAALQVEPRFFVASLMRFYEPVVFDILFPQGYPAAGGALLRSLVPASKM